MRSKVLVRIDRLLVKLVPVSVKLMPNPDCYLHMKRIKQLYMELYKTENIEKFRSIIIPIERNAAA